jgi:hypothetical protein
MDRVICVWVDPQLMRPLRVEALIRLHGLGR